MIHLYIYIYIYKNYCITNVIFSMISGRKCTKLITVNDYILPANVECEHLLIEHVNQPTRRRHNHVYTPETSGFVNTFSRVDAVALLSNINHHYYSALSL